MTENQIIQQLDILLKSKDIDYQKILELSSKLAKFDSENFRFSIDAGALINLGRDSIKDHTTAIIELVKNSYDADATKVEVEILIEKEKGLIRIADNGIGMTSNEVIANWLRIGYSEKKQNKQTARKRRKTGEKGIGRLSADRLGASLQLITKSTSNIFGLEINWNDFEKQGVDLGLVPLKTIFKPKINIPGKAKTGTELIINNLRNSWQEPDFKQLWSELSALTSPFKKVKDFEVIIKTNIDTEYKGKVESPLEHFAEVDLTMKFNDRTQEFVYTIKNKYKLIQKTNKKIKWNSLINYIIDVKKHTVKQKLMCGPVEIRLLFYLRESNTIEGTKLKLKDFLDEKVGVKIYRDNISVKPYGIPFSEGNDWLDLSLRQGQNPAGISRQDFRVKPNQIIGAVFISRDRNPQLKDSSAREGLIHSDTFYDLRAITLASIRLLETHRHELFALNPTQTKARKSSRQILDEYKEEVSKLKEELNELRTKEIKELYQAKKQIDIVLDKTITTEKTIDDLLDKSRTLSGLATVGISSAVFGHETQISISSFRLAAGQALIDLKKKNPDIISAVEELEKAIKFSDHISAWGTFALSRIKKDKRRKENLQLRKVTEILIKEIKESFNAVGITINTNLEDITVRGYAMDIETILLNLLTNAYSACLQKNKERNIRVELSNSNVNDIEGFKIIVADSGSGVNDDIKNMIWEQFFTTKVDDFGKEKGTGLGLSIVDSIVQDLNGKRFIEKDSVLKGAKFIIWIPKE